MTYQIPHGFENGPGPFENWSEWHERLLAYEASMQEERRQLVRQLDQHPPDPYAAFRRTWRRRRPWLLGCGSALVVGSVFLLIGSQMNSPMAEPATPGAPQVAVGLVLIGSVIAIALCSLIRFSIKDMIAISHYIREWKKTATPEQLALYYAGQAAALWGAHIALRHSNERQHERYEARNARQRYIHDFLFASPEQRATMKPPPGMSSSWGG